MESRVKPTTRKLEPQPEPPQQTAIEPEDTREECEASAEEFLSCEQSLKDALLRGSSLDMCSVDEHSFGEQVSGAGRVSQAAPECEADMFSQRMQRNASLSYFEPVSRRWARRESACELLRVASPRPAFVK